MCARELRSLFNVRSQDWQRYIKTVKSPQGAVYARIAAITYGPYDGYFDNIQFEKSELPRGYNFIENSSFEKSSERWIPPDSSATVVNQAEPYSYSGNYNAQISLSTTGTSYHQTEYPVPANVNLYYTLTGFIRTTGVSTPSYGGAWLHIYFYDGSGNPINDYVTKGITGNTGWTKYVITFKPPANTVTMKVRADLYNASGTANFDNIRLNTGKLSVNSAYDGNQNYVTSVKDQLNNTVTITPDAYGQAKTVVSPTGETTNYTYNGQEQLKTVKDNAYNTTSYTLDANGNVTDVSTATNYNKSIFQYDVNGNLFQEKDALNNITSFNYDECGRITKKTNPNATSVSTGYDFYGNLNSIKLSGGSTYEFGYDLSGQRKTSIVKDSAGQKTNEFNYDYDEVGNLIDYKELDGAGTQIGEIAAPSSPAGTKMYSDINQINGFDLKFGTVTVTYNFSYTKGGLIKEVASGGKTFTFQYDESNNLLSRTYANSTQDVYTYNEANQVVKTQTLDSASQPKWSSQYMYDADGRITQITGTGPGSPSATYVYNDAAVGENLNRLTKAIINDGSGDQTFNYRYDPAGNMTSMTVPYFGAKTFSYDADNRITSSGFSYDTNGNLTAAAMYGTTFNYVYDSANRLTTVKDSSNNLIAEYTYDGDGRRLTKTAKNASGQFETTTYHYFQGEVLYETNSSDPANVLRARYIRTLEGKLLGVSLYRPALQQYYDYYYHYNAQGDVVAVTDSNGSVYRQYVYDPYGNIISVKDGGGNAIDIGNDPDFNHAYTYRGYRFDPEAGLYLLNSRYYAAGIGRFLTKDRVLGNDADPQSLNRYAYAEGDPITFVDPDGHGIDFALRLGGLGGLGLGAGIGLGLGTLGIGLLAIGVAVGVILITDYLMNSSSDGTASDYQSGDTVSDDDFPTVGGPPNGDLTLHNPETGRTQRRFYDEEGKAKKDIDLNHGNDEPFPHVHDWEPIIGKGKVRRVPGPGRTKLTPEELDSIKDILHLLNKRYRQLPF